MKTGLLMGAAVAVAAVIGLVAQQRPVDAPPHTEVARTGAMGDPFDSGQLPNDPPSSSLHGRVREVIEVAQYTYLRLGTPQGEVWAAVTKAPVAMDNEVTVENPMRMEHFQSTTLGRTFDVIYFGNLPTGGAAASGKLPPGHPSIDGAATMFAGHGAPTSATPAGGGSGLAVPRASGSNARTIAELFSEGAKLEGKLLRVRGQVVKVTAGVLGKTYLRLRDGSSASPEQRELVVTSQAEARVGDVATFEGTLRTQVDVGIGFRYPILLSDAQVIADEP
jgi:hypothetical protein